jgi:phosphate starvation-inducible protein PhoH
LEKHLKRTKRRRETNSQTSIPSTFELDNINPMGEAQSKVFRAYRDDKNLLLYGTAGTGKTFISLYLALKEIETSEQYNRIVIVRSVVPTRDMGFLPGSIRDKSMVYETPYWICINKLYGRGDAYEELKRRGTIEFVTTSFLRGTTLENCIIIFDEYENTTLHEFSSVITRAGENCKLLICGDTRQNDLTDKTKSESMHVVSIMERMPSFDVIKFGLNDIVRSGLVREFLKAKIELNLD